MVASSFAIVVDGMTIDRTSSASIVSVDDNTYGLIFAINSLKRTLVK